MKKLVNFIKHKLALLGAVFMAAIVGGASTAIVMAAIPDTNGRITACRLNLTGVTRIIDTASESCNALETAVSWRQGPLAYAHITYDATVSNEYMVDSNRSDNISYLYSDTSTPETQAFLCLRVENGNPKNIIGIGGPDSNSGPGFFAIKDENGWSASGDNHPYFPVSSVDFCEQHAPSANVAFMTPGVHPDSGKTDFFLTIF